MQTFLKTSPNCRRITVHVHAIDIHGKCSKARKIRPCSVSTKSKNDHIFAQKNLPAFLFNSFKYAIGVTFIVFLSITLTQVIFLSCSYLYQLTVLF